MRLPEACFKSKTGEAGRINAFGVKYMAMLCRLDNGEFEIKYTRQITKNHLAVEVSDRSEVEGYDDWVVIEEYECPYCHGTGDHDIDGKEECSHCDGSGKLRGDK